MGVQVVIFRVINYFSIRRFELSVLTFFVSYAFPVSAAVENNHMWTYIDPQGVVHIGNVAAPVTRGVVWLNRQSSEGAGNARNTLTHVPAHQLRGFGAAKPHLEAAAQFYSLDPALVTAVAAVESGFKHDAISRKGAMGLMQVMPATAARYDVVGGAAQFAERALLDPQVNAQIGARYLADLLRMFDGELELALAAYNAGEGAVMKYGRRVPPYPETQQYVSRVMRYYRSLTGRTG